MRAIGPDLPIPASAGIETPGLIFTSGQVPIASDGTIPNGVRAQTDLVLDLIEAVLTAGGSGLNRIVKTTVFLAKANDFAAFNDAYAARLGPVAPARSTVVARLLPPVLVEIEATAER